MESEKRYFIVNIPNPNMERIYELTIQNVSTIRKSLDGKFGIVTLPFDDDQNHGVLKNATEFTKHELQQYLRENPENWHIGINDNI